MRGDGRHACACRLRIHVRQHHENRRGGGTGPQRHHARRDHRGSGPRPPSSPTTSGFSWSAGPRTRSACHGRAPASPPSTRPEGIVSKGGGVRSGWMPARVNRSGRGGGLRHPGQGGLPGGLGGERGPQGAAPPSDDPHRAAGELLRSPLPRVRLRRRRRPVRSTGGSPWPRRPRLSDLPRRAWP